MKNAAAHFSAEVEGIRQVNETMTFAEEKLHFDEPVHVFERMYDFFLLLFMYSYY